MNSDLVKRLQEFIESEARSCSMDSGCITPEYVFRMWGGVIPLEAIKIAMDVAFESPLNKKCKVNSER